MDDGTPPVVKRFWKLPVLAAVYFAAAKWGLTLAFVQANATAVWPPTGIALAALLIGGQRLWPGIFLGAFLANLSTNGTVLTSLAIASGNSLEALLGAALIERWAGGRKALGSFPTLFRFALFGGLIAPVVSATVGVGSLSLAGFSDSALAPDVWLTWWLGDMAGALVVAPPLLLLPPMRWPRPSPGRLAESFVLVVLVVLSVWVLFSGQCGISRDHAPVPFILMPTLLWIAVRYSPFTTSMTVLAVSFLAVGGTQQGFGPFYGPTPNQSLVFLQAFMAIISLTLLALSTAAEERRKVEEELRWSESDLQLKVLVRTEELTRTNLRLEKEAREKEALAQELGASHEKFRLLSEATQEGVVLMDHGLIHGANSTFCRMFGYGLAEVIGRPPTDFVVPEAREAVQENISSHYEGTYPVRGLKKDGTVLDIEVTGRTVRLDGGTARVTAIRDVTERNRQEEEIRKLALLVETSSDFICLTSVDGHMTYLNRAGRDLTGLSRDEDIGQKLHEDFIAPGDVPRLRSEVLATLMEKGSWAGEFELRHFKTGEPLPMHFTAALIRDPASGEPKALAGIGRDTREMKKKDEEIRRTALFMENVQDYVIYFLDPAGKIISWNEGAQRVKGYEAREAIGRDFSIFYTPEDIQAGKPGACLEQAVRRGRVEEEGWRVRKDGTRFWADTILTALRDEKGALKGFAKITRDVTSRKRMEELARSNKELEQFAYVASHDLQEPLRMIASFVQLLAHQYKGKLDAEADEYIGHTVDGVKRMQALIKDLLAYSRLGTTQPFTRVDCGKALEEALRNLDPSLREHHVEVERDPLPEVLGDNNQIVQVFQNLIGNAVKFRSQRSPRIQVGAADRGDEWLFSVQDNGIGLDPQYGEQIFEVFKRLHSRQEYPGTGIGLAICKKVVTRHGGRIWVESKPGEGACFYWTLPKMKGGTS
ncbi:MAG TPA: PAS domain S-box protein [bacterium]|nr:PAS domain S-box protein [bacterium]